MDELTLTLPLPPNMANTRMKWQAKHGRKLKYWALCDAYRMRKDNPARWDGGEPPERVAIRAKLYVWNLMDEGNALARLKWTEDWLTRNRYIVDDARPHLRWAAIPEQEIDRKDQRVEITLTREEP